jgi:hypothetical protein
MINAEPNPNGSEQQEQEYEQPRTYYLIYCTRNKFLAYANVLASRSVDFKWEPYPYAKDNMYTIEVFVLPEDVVAMDTVC